MFEKYTLWTYLFGPRCVASHVVSDSPGRYKRPYTKGTHSSTTWLSTNQYTCTTFFHSFLFWLPANSTDPPAELINTFYHYTLIFIPYLFHIKCVMFNVFFFLPVIEENGVRLKLTVTDTPGFGDHINNENW